MSESITMERTITAQAARIAELEQANRDLNTMLQVAVAAQRAVPVTTLRYIVNSHPSLPVDDRITAGRWLDSLDGDA